MTSVRGHHFCRENWTVALRLSPRKGRGQPAIRVLLMSLEQCIQTRSCHETSAGSPLVACPRAAPERARHSTAGSREPLSLITKPKTHGFWFFFSLSFNILFFVFWGFLFLITIRFHFASPLARKVCLRVQNHCFKSSLDGGRDGEPHHNQTGSEISSSRRACSVLVAEISNPIAVKTSNKKELAYPFPSVLPTHYTFSLKGT